jgi:hypothetical protein
VWRSDHARGLQAAFAEPSAWIYWNTLSDPKNRTWAACQLDFRLSPRPAEITFISYQIPRLALLPRPVPRNRPISQSGRRSAAASQSAATNENLRRRLVLGWIVDLPGVLDPSPKPCLPTVIGEALRQGSAPNSAKYVTERHESRSLNHRHVLRP